MKQKVIGIVFILTILILFGAGTINAASQEFNTAKEIVGKVLESMRGIATPFFEKIIGDAEGSKFFFAKILLLLLLVLISNKVISKTPLGKDNSKLSVTIAIIVSVLAIRFIKQSELVEGILIPYGALGVAITTLLPFIIFFYFLHNSNIKKFGRKIGWIFYGAIFIAIWFSKFSELSSLSNGIYISIIIAAGLAAYFDKSFHRYFGMSGMREINRESSERTKRELLREMQQLRADFSKSVVDRGYYKRERDRINRAILELEED